MKRPRTLLALWLACSTTSVTAGDVEILHWWTSGGEANAATYLKDNIEARGHHWKNFAIAGGGGESAMTVLKTRAVSGNPPSAAQLKGLDIQEWGRLGFLSDLSVVADEAHWPEVVPDVARRIMLYNDQYVAVPVNIHRVNWLWANPAILAKVGVEVPRTLPEFFAAADKIKQAGYIPLAHGGQQWQNVTLFETIALAVLGAEGYQRAFVDLDMSVLSSPKMVEVFRQFLRLRDYIDPGYRGRDWNSATEMVSRGEAAMQIMGDWAKGEFAAEGLKPGQDYLCVAAPGTVGQFTYNIDSFAFFKLTNEADIKAQQDLARILLDKTFQVGFNQRKGSIPVRMDMDMTPFDQCARDSMTVFRESLTNGGLVPSLSQGMASTSYVQAAISDVVSDYFNAKAADPEQAAQRLARAVKSAM
ncbi:carbohydrate ABC transporter substrate-binding protein [Photobacterium ganghwense]|uniref:Probable sugar-binding periplasmic protein n=1 Tax=Photobacterium ganghwense TaxID=320778 RepID=A0A0J1HDT2_9GAMM|nr:ABC transporter substrate-binding protein [Photobacterium ganghwense]KLV09778.1 sugar ABC transporter substrate-binding protein [Photobacterium ganghwense]PSU09381.1 carbohydrate ABC transporter substrate-binding protein [Photobacterium ganghwense]QSV16571.1 carbohydrate ABC transporter substrate-binding protein [Photobacterium ganghwense]